MENLCVIILAAGKGTRMQSTDTNKVALKLGGEPMLLRTIKTLREAGVRDIVVVVGFAKESVTSFLDDNVIIAEQKEQLGTGHAVECALTEVPERSKDVLIIYGDDSFLHTPSTFKDLYSTHIDNNSTITFITRDSDNPTGMGRIIRDTNGKIKGIVEEKNATDEEKKIKEINLGCYVVDKKYLTENIKKIGKNEVTGEYYITDIIDIISKDNGKISSYQLNNQQWKGVNTPQDLDEAQQLLSNA